MENPINVEGQNSQQIEQNQINLPTQIPEKRKVNYWVIPTVVFFILLLLAGGVFYLLESQRNQSVSQNFEQKTALSTSLSPVNPTNITVVYAYNQYAVLNNNYDTLTPIQTKVFKTDYNNQNKVELNIGYHLSTSNTDPYQTKGYLYKTTSDGKYIFRWSRDHKSVEVASAPEFNSFQKLVDIPQGNIRTVTVARNAHKIAYTVKSDKDERVYVMDINDAKQKLVKTTNDSQNISSIDYNALNNQLYIGYNQDGWVVEGERLILNDDGSIKSTQKEPLTEEQPQFTKDFKKAYIRTYIDDKEAIVEQDMTSNKRKALYKLNDNKGGDRITTFMLSPTDDKLIFEQENITKKRVLYSVSLTDGNVSVLLDDPQYYGLVPALCGQECFGGSNAWSPDGKYILLEGVVCTYNDLCKLHEGEVYLMDIDSKKMSLFFKPSDQIDQLQPQKRVKDLIEFIGWLAQ